MQLFGDLDTLSFARVSRLNWIGRVNRMDSKRKVSQAFNNHPQGSRLRGRPKNRRWNFAQIDINKFKKYKLEREVKINRADCEKLIEQTKVRIGLYCHRRRKKKMMMMMMNHQSTFWTTFI